MGCYCKVEIFMDDCDSDVIRIVEKRTDVRCKTIRAPECELEMRVDYLDWPKLWFAAADICRHLFDHKDTDLWVKIDNDADNSRVFILQTGGSFFCAFNIGDDVRRYRKRGEAEEVLRRYASGKKV